jgi:Tfp pilus assembly protein FimT
MTSNQNHRGITIIELMAVMCILTVLLGFASIGTDLVSDARLRSATQGLLSDIQLSRIRAMTHDGRGYGIRFMSASSYVVFRFEDCNDSNSYEANGCAGGTREETNGTIKNIPPAVALKRQNPATDFNNNILIFDRNGVSRSATWAFGNMTIVVKNDVDQNGMKCITVSATRVREGVWGWDNHAGKYGCLE